MSATPVTAGLPAAAAAVIQVAWPWASIRAIPLDRCAGVAPVTVNPKYTDPSGPAVSGVVNVVSNTSNTNVSQTIAVLPYGYTVGAGINP